MSFFLVFETILSHDLDRKPQFIKNIELDDHH